MDFSAFCYRAAAERRTKYPHIYPFWADNATSKGFLFRDYAKRGINIRVPSASTSKNSSRTETNICGFHLNWNIMHVGNKIEFTILWRRKYANGGSQCTAQPDAFCFRVINIYVDCAIVSLSPSDKRAAHCSAISIDVASGKNVSKRDMNGIETGLGKSCANLISTRSPNNHNFIKARISFTVNKLNSRHRGNFFRAAEK